MRTLLEVKNEVARNHAFDDWEEALNGAVYPSLDKLIDLVVKEYAKQAIEGQLKVAAMEADVNYDGYLGSMVWSVDTDSILNCTRIELK